MNYYKQYSDMVCPIYKFDRITHVDIYDDYYLIYLKNIVMVANADGKPTHYKCHPNSPIIVGKKANSVLNYKNKQYTVPMFNELIMLVEKENTAIAIEGLD